MIIVGQDKFLITNFDNITVIGVNKEDSRQIFSVTNNGDKQFLGKYENKERAKEVLQEITRKYKATEAFKVSVNRLADSVGALAIKESFVFEMPER